ncbi:hypothetical protein AAE250_09480 [Bacteroides sp. GD17]
MKNSNAVRKTTKGEDNDAESKDNLFNMHFWGVNPVLPSISLVNDYEVSD